MSACVAFLYTQSGMVCNFSCCCLYSVLSAVSGSLTLYIPTREVMTGRGAILCTFEGNGSEYQGRRLFD